MVKECIEKGLCTNTLPQRMPQKMGYDYPHYYCETCWIHCQQQSPTELRWHMEGMKCQCESCPRRSKKQKVE